MPRDLYGRSEIFTDETAITRDNVVQVLEDSMAVHQKNSTDIDYLFDYYKGKQDIVNKVKEIREDINHKICENRAFEIVTFFLGFIFGEAIQYIRRGTDESTKTALEELNGHMYDNDKTSLDRALAEWMFIGGVGYRLVLPTSDFDSFSYVKPPFSIYTLDPRYAYVVKFNNLAQDYAMGVKYIEKKDSAGLGTKVFSVYTKDTYYEIQDGTIMKEEPHVIGEVPFVEYPANSARLGVFEIVVPLLDAINELQSNRLDDVVQTVNSFLALMGGELDEEAYKRIQEWKMVCLPEGTDAKYLSQPMAQSDIQILTEGLYQNVLTIIGMPNRNGGSSTSDTGQAVYLRDGWSGAETKAKNIETMFKASERRTIQLVAGIMKDMTGTVLIPRNVEVKFPMRYKENLLSITQSMLNLLESGVHPEVVIATMGIWSDPKAVYELSKSSLLKWDVELPEDEELDANESFSKNKKEGVNV